MGIINSKAKCKFMLQKEENILFPNDKDRYAFQAPEV